MKALECRMCGSLHLRQWLDLGLHPHSDHFHKEKEAEMFYPLGVSVCEDCGLNQLTYIVAKESLYLEDYLYESSITKTASDHWQELADTVCEKLSLKKDEKFEYTQIIDIGSNDGTLLTKFQEKGFSVRGIDPTPEATQLAIDRGVPTTQKFFNSEEARYIAMGYGLNEHALGADLVLGTNVFAHIDDLDDFMKGVKFLLKQGGVFVFESPYFGEFLKGLEYDTVYHQHLSYLSLKPVVKFLEKHDMEVFDVELHELHGGVFRVYIARKGQREVQPSVQEMLDGETWNHTTLEDFAEDTRKNAVELRGYLAGLHARGKTIAVVSTPAKGNTLLNYCGIGRYIDFATDKSKLKQGRYTPGTQILVLSDEELVKRQPDYALVLAWNFFPEIVANVKKMGYKGKFIRPLPKVETI